MTRLVFLAAAVFVAAASAAPSAKAIIAALHVGTELLVTWKPYWVMDGQGVVTGFYRAAAAVHQLKAF